MLYEVITGAFLLLYPVCFLSGYLFTLFSTGFSLSDNQNQIGKAYAWESLGSLFGGLLFSFILGRFFNSSQVFGITAALVFVVSSWICENKYRRIILMFSVITSYSIHYTKLYDSLPALHAGYFWTSQLVRTTRDGCSPALDWF